MIVGSALLATTNSFLNYNQPYIWGYKTTQTLVSAVKGCYTEFMTIPFSSLFNGGGLLELEIQENSPRHTSSKFIIPMSYDDSNNSVIRRILPISTQGRRSSSPSGYGSGEVALEFYKDVSSNSLIFRLRSVGDTDQTGSLQTNILVKNFHGDVSFSNITGIDTSNYNYSIYRLTPLTQNKSNVGINIAEPSATLHVNGNVLVETSVSAKNSFILSPASVNSVTPPADGFGLVLRNQNASPYIAGGLVSFRNIGVIFQDGQCYLGTTTGGFYLDFYEDSILKTRSDFGIGWSNNTDARGSTDLTLFRDTANTLAQRNSTNAQTFRIYNTYTNASSYERVSLGWNSNLFELKPEGAGAGLARTARIWLGNAGGSAATSYIEGKYANKVNIAVGGANEVWVFDTGYLVDHYTPNSDVTIGARKVGTGNLNFGSPHLKLQGGGGTGTARGSEVWAEGSLTGPSGTQVHTYHELFRGYIRTSGEPMFSIGGSTSSFPAFKRSETTLKVRLADDSGDANLTCSNLTAYVVSATSAIITTNISAVNYYNTSGALPTTISTLYDVSGSVIPAEGYILIYTSGKWVAMPPTIDGGSASG